MQPKYLTYWRHRFQKQLDEDKKRAESARSELPKAIRILKQHGAKRIILFGSLREGHRFRGHPDIDLAVEVSQNKIFVEPMPI
ncbi:MAG: nucleotidyltransferase domain-containing protein [bacterium]